MEDQKTLKQRLIARWTSARKSFDANFEQRDRDFVTMEMRRRGDYAGKFSIRENNWRPGLSSAVVSYPVIARAFRSNTATSVATDIVLTFEPSTANPAKRNAVELLKSIYKFEAPRLWDESLETRHADFGQLGGFTALKISINEDDETSFGPRPKRIDRVIEMTNDQVITCANCGRNHSPEDLGLANGNENGLQGFAPEVQDEMKSKGMADEDILEAYRPKYELTGEECCMECGQPGQLTPMNDPEVGFNEIPSKETEELYDRQITIDVISPLLIRFDTVSSIGFQYEKAEWFNQRYLKSKASLKAKYPQLKEKIDGFPTSKWSHGVKWFYELGKPNLAQSDQLGDNDEKRWFAEVDCVFFKRCMFEGEKADDTETLELEGQKITIQKDQPIIEAIENATKKEFQGLEMYFLGDEILEVELIDEDDEFVLIPWRLNPTCSVPNGEERLIRLQDQVTNLLSMRYQMTVRRGNTPLVADSLFFEKADLTRNQAGQIIMTKSNAPAMSGNINTHLAYATPPEIDGSDMEFIQLLIGVAKEESGVFDETIGNTDSSNKTARGRELAINQSLGLLGITQKSKKLGKIKAFRTIAKLWQQKPDESFECLRGIYEDGITPQDIADFKALNVDRDVLITEVQGSDIPKNTPDQFNAYQIAVSWQLFMPNSPLPLEHRQYILRNVLGLPIDLENYEADRRLAAKRVEVIQGILKRKREELEQMSQSLLIVGPDKFGRQAKQLHPDAMAAITVDPQTRITEFDTHLIFIDYYDNQLKGLLTSRDVNEPMILALQAQMEGHKAIAQQMAMQEMAAANMATQAATIASDPNLQPDGQPQMQPVPAQEQPQPNQPQ